MLAGVLWFLVLGVCLRCSEGLSSVDGDHFPPNRVKRCMTHRTYKKIASDCHGRDFNNVPSNLNSNIQVLDLSYNRIRELDSDSFARYSSLELLFLDENMISYVSNDTFEPLQYLEVVLLRLNALSHVPTSLFSLPYLRKVDLSENRLHPGGLQIFSEAPRTNQLKWLSLTSCHIHHLPPLHRFSRLEFLNVSDNPLGQLDILELAPLCSLKQVDLGSSYKLLSQCNCELLAQWATDDGITVYPPEALDCVDSQDAGKSQCRSMNSSRQAQKLRAQCVTVLAEQQQKAHMTKA